MPGGGPRKGTGPKVHKALAKPGPAPNLEVQSEASETKARVLKYKFNKGLATLASIYPEVIGWAIDKARGGDGAMIRHLIDLPLRVLDLSDEQKTPFDGLREKWTLERSIPTEIAKEHLGQAGDEARDTVTARDETLA
jgi:hypothetical protein